MGKFIDLTGQKFGRLTVIERAPNKDHHSLWICNCECGNMVTIRADYLKSGHSKSCGCNSRDLFVLKHGKIKTRLYHIWENAKARCNNPNCKDFQRYGQRGIKLCPEWDNDFSAFYDWALANGYTNKLTLDRIDNDKGYTPDNCQWITKSENSKKRWADK